MASPSPRLVENQQIQSSELLSPRPFFLHAYVWPFTIVWPAFLSVYLSTERYDRYIGGEEFTFVWVGTIITIQSLVWLTTHWSVNLRAAFTTNKASSVQDAQLIKVVPVANAGSADICKIDRERVSSIAFKVSSLGYARHVLTARAPRSPTRPTPRSSSRSAASYTTL